MKKLLLASMVIFAFGGCKNNPYPDGTYSPNPIPHNEVQEQPALMVPSKVIFSEGIAGSFGVSGKIPNGEAVLTIDNLPAGAVFSPQEGKVKWTPGFDQGNDPSVPNSSYRDYTITVMLSDAKKPKVILAQEDITLIVNDVPRAFMFVDLNPNNSIYEGSEETYDFTIQDLDYPKGPFKLTLADAPAGTTIVQNPANPAKFTIHFICSYDTVTWKDVQASGKRSKLINWTLTAMDPNRRFISAPMSWEIYDERQYASYIGPKDLTVTSQNIDFIFMAADPNLEDVPTVKVSPVSQGTLKVDPMTLPTVKKGARDMPKSAFHVSWTNIPKTAAGKTDRLSINMCVHRYTQNPDNCTSQNVQVKFDFTKGGSL